MSRRAIIRQVGLASLIALPAITNLVAPTAAHAASGLCAGVNCDNGNACTTDRCDPQIGCVQTAVNCVDGDACTTDSCDPRIGCVHTSIICDDGNACTINNCSPAIGCFYTSVICPAGQTCDPARGCV